MRKGILSASVALGILFMGVTAYADEVKYISSAEDMEQLRQDPSGTYQLTNDIDMSGVDWIPVTFSGKLDGSGYAILNLSVNTTGGSVRTTYDGNYKEYDTVFGGLFDVMENASVKNLALLGVNVNVATSSNCFVGAIAGYMNGSTIANSSAEGTIALDTSGQIIGVGGLAGFGGASSINDCIADVTLICIDEDIEYKDEQYMGGAYAAGYIDLGSSSVIIRGYDSDHGYVHDGGLIGMYMCYPKDNDYFGYVNNNNVVGGITFFEDNTDRRAYCSEFVGELETWNFDYTNNNSNFIPEEVFDYSTTLLPHYCENPVFSKEFINKGISRCPYTLFTCTTCGEYSYKGRYQLPGTEAPTEEETTPEETTPETTAEETTVEETTSKETSEETTTEKATKADAKETTADISETVKESTTASSGGIKKTETTAAPEIEEKSKNKGFDYGFLFVILLIVGIPAAIIPLARNRKKSKGRGRGRRK